MRLHSSPRPVAARGLSAVVCLPCLLFASPQAYFSSQDNLQYQVSQAIARSHQELAVAVFELSSRPLIEALRQAAQRGVSVRVLLNATSPPQRLANDSVPNLEVRYLPGRRGGVMHNKFMVIDQAELMTGSFNWTPGAQYVNYENLLKEDDAGLVAAYGRQFELLWSRATRHPGDPSAEHHRKKKRSRHSKESL